MSRLPREETRERVETHVPRFAQVRPLFACFADTLQQVLGLAAAKRAPQAITQTRVKTVPSFAEKVIRKQHLYDDPLVDMTDLCGGRVITQTAEQVHSLCRFIEQHFVVDWDNSADVSQRLRPTEFGYRSVHYIVSFKPGVFPTKDVPLEVPAELLAGLPGQLFDAAAPAIRPLKAEIQVRTLLEHAWADVGHDTIYKPGMRVPDAIHREFASIAAILENVDREFGRIHDSLHAYASNYGGYMREDEVRAEIDKLRLVMHYEQSSRADLAARIATLAMTMGDWQQAVDVLEPYRDSDSHLARKCLGVALCQLHLGAPDDAGFRSGRDLLEILANPSDAATPPATGQPLVAATSFSSESLPDPEVLCALGDAWRGEQEERARDYYRRAFDIQPTHPDCLASYLEHEIACHRNADVLLPASPTIAAACRRCRNQITARVNLPRAYLNLARFHLFLGQPHESLGAMAKLIQICPADYLLAAADESLERLEVIAAKLPGFEWLQRLVLLGRVARFDVPHAKQRLRSMAAAITPDPRQRLVIVAGGCDASVEAQMQGYRDLLVEAFKDFEGTVVCGGTTQGISGLAGDVRQQYGRRLRLVGYIPQHVPHDATVDRDNDRYDELRATDAKGFGPLERGFTPLEPLQSWLDILAAGIDPRSVRLLGFNGGAVAATEYRIAAALGAEVGLVEESGREAARLFTDPDWQHAPRIRRLAADPAVLRAFIGGAADLLDDHDREAVARAIHDSYRTQRASQQQEDPRLADWEQLDETYKQANLGQADHLFVKLREVGCRAVPKSTKASSVKLSKDEIERLARLEHGRWVVDRLRDGWRYGATRDNDRKIHPALLPWEKLSQEDQEKDREAARQLPELLAKIGLRATRDKRRGKR